MIYDVIIIGGGIAGLNIAYQLSKGKTTFLLLEKTKHLGGRIATYHSNTMTVEMGAGRFSLKHKLLVQLLKEFDLYDKHVKNSTHTEYIPLHEKSDNYLSIVLEKGKKMNKEILRQMTFEEYAKTVLNENEVEEIKKSFGYYSELVMMNAYDSIRLMRVLDSTFYSLEGGLSQLIERMRDRILESKKPFRYEQHVLDIIPTYEKSEEYYQIPTKGETYNARACVLAIPKESLEKMPVLRPIQSMLSQVKTSPLCRIYSRYDEPWFSGLSKITTDDNLRMVIPVQEKILMSSYTDNKFANYWKRIYDTKGIDGIDQTLTRHLKRVIQQTHPKIEVPFPKETHVFYWEHGVGYWAKHANSEKTAKEMLQPFSGPLRNIYICGESYSEKQQWIEGSLETSMKVFDKLNVLK